MKNAQCDECKDAKFGIAYIDPESGILCSKIDTDMELPKGKKILAPNAASIFPVKMLPTLVLTNRFKESGSTFSTPKSPSASIRFALKISQNRQKVNRRGRSLVLLCFL